MPPEDIDAKMKTLEGYKTMKLVSFTIAGLFGGIFLGGSLFWYEVSVLRKDNLK